MKEAASMMTDSSEEANSSGGVLLPLGGNAGAGYEYRPQHSFIEKSPNSGQNSALQFANNTNVGDL
jgi:hypothetical protein